jgi:XTP/dITP diphosphohydrolase
MKVFFITGNEGKVREARAILSPLGIEVVQEKLEVPEIQDTDAEKVSRSKALEAFSKLKRPLFVEDVGLHIRSMGGYPGALVKHFREAIGIGGISACTDKSERSAEAVAAIAFCGSDGSVRTFSGAVRGSISEEPRGSYTFGFDPIFIPEGHEKTFGEMGMEEKNRISHRRKALEKFAEWLKGGIH